MRIECRVSSWRFKPKIYSKCWPLVESNCKKKKNRNSPFWHPSETVTCYPDRQKIKKAEKNNFVYQVKFYSKKKGKTNRRYTSWLHDHPTSSSLCCSCGSRCEHEIRGIRLLPRLARPLSTTIRSLIGRGILKPCTTPVLYLIPSSSPLSLCTYVPPDPHGDGGSVKNQIWSGWPGHGHRLARGGWAGLVMTMIIAMAMVMVSAPCGSRAAHVHWCLGSWTRQKTGLLWALCVLYKVA